MYAVLSSVCGVSVMNACAPARRRARVRCDRRAARPRLRRVPRRASASQRRRGSSGLAQSYISAWPEGDAAWRVARITLTRALLSARQARGRREGVHPTVDRDRAFELVPGADLGEEVCAVG